MKHVEAGMSGLIETQGQWLFHRRSYFGLVMLPLLAWAIWFPGYPANHWSDAAIDHLALVGLIISIAGLILRCFTVGTVPADTSRRSTRELRAESLNTTGMYSLLRHPLYLANGIVITGFVVAVGSFWLFAVFQLAHALYIERIITVEDRFLARKYPDAWPSWAARTPALIPRPRLWKANTLDYSIRTVFRREYNSAFVITLAFFTLQTVRALLKEHLSLHTWLVRDSMWVLLLACGLLCLLVLRTLKRHTRVLHVRGR